MNIADFLDPANILPDMKARNHWEAIDELLNNLVASGKITTEHRPAIERAVKQRETSMSTAMGSGIGLPHARTELVTEFIAAFGRSKAGIDFDAPDQEPVHSVFLFLAPKDQTQKLVDTLANFTKLLAQMNSEQPH